MLVLTRTVGEKVLIGKDITITVVRVLGHRVRIGIEAPKGVKILREELAMNWPEVREPRVDAPCDEQRQ